MIITDIVNGIVLKNNLSGEADIRCHILTTEGVHIATAVGALRPKAKLRNAVQLFTIAEFTIAGTKITGAHVLQSGIGVARELHRYYLCCAISETILSLTQGKESTAELFVLTASSLDTIANTDISAYKVLINFFTKFLVLMGYDTDSADTELTEKINEFKETDNADIDSIDLSYTQAKQCVKLLESAYKDHLEFKIPSLEQF